MAPSLAHFPELCLEVIFKHVPLSDLLCSVGRVCKSWDKLRRIELKKRGRLQLVTDGKQETLNDYHIHLFSNGTDLIGRVRRDDGSPWHALESVEQIKFNTLTVPGGQWPAGRMQTFIASLKNLSITRLHLNFDCSHSDLTKVIRQLDHFSKNLVELKLFNSFHPHRRRFENVGTATQKLADRLFVCLNRMQSLKHLQLDLFLVNVRVRPEQLSWLSRLENFAIRTCNFEIEDWILAALNRYARNVTSIEVYNIASILDIIDFVEPQIDGQLAAKFTTLSIIIENRIVSSIKYEYMRQICTHFSSLTKLELHSYFFSMPMTKLARCLSLLTQLVHLDLRYGPIPPIEEALPEEDDEGDEGDEEEEEEDPVEEEQDGGEHAEQVPQEITQLPSVRLLILSFSADSHRDTERLFISDIFPNLQVLALKNIYLQCQDCEIGLREDGGYHRTEGTDFELARRIAQCSRLARRPFRGCASLHTVALIDSDNNETLITLDDL